jgi:alpha-ribazole phosphatase/probable phosphoglycerate mutase
MLEKRMTTVDLLRHGEPVGGRKYRGQTDDPLSETGWTQMRSAMGEHRPWDVVVSSTLLRCIEFARELAAWQALPLETDARLVELGFGAWEGRTPAELMAADPQQLARFLEDPLRYAPPGAEPLPGFQQRVQAAWRELLTRHAGRHILVVGHAGIIRLIVSEVLELPLARLFRLHVPHAGLTRIQVEHHGERLMPQLLFHAGRL